MKLDKPNINTTEYLNDLYYNPHWKDGYQDAYKRLDLEISKLPELKKHLDIGCADGYFTKKYLEKYPNTDGVGIDLSWVVVKDLGDNFKDGDIYSLDFNDQVFDLVHCAEIFEHLEEPEKAIKEVYRVLRPNGTLILSVPNDDKEYEEHIYSWTPQEVVDLLDDFEIVEMYNEFFNGHIIWVKAIKR